MTSFLKIGRPPRFVLLNLHSNILALYLKEVLRYYVIGSVKMESTKKQKNDRNSDENSSRKRVMKGSGQYSGGRWGEAHNKQPKNKSLPSLEKIREEGDQNQAHNNRNGSGYIHLTSAFRSPYAILQGSNLNHEHDQGHHNRRSCRAIVTVIGPGISASENIKVRVVSVPSDPSSHCIDPFGCCKNWVNQLLQDKTTKGNIIKQLTGLPSD